MTPIELYPFSNFVPSNDTAFAKKWNKIDNGLSFPITDHPLTEKRIDIVNTIIVTAFPKQYGRKAYVEKHCQITRNKLESLISGKGFNFISDLDLIKLMTLPNFSPIAFQTLLILFDRNPYAGPFSTLLDYFKSQHENHSFTYHASAIEKIFPDINVNN